MYVGCELLADGRQLLTAAQRQGAAGLPDLCVVDGPRRIWIEAIAPTAGQPGPNQVVGPVPINQGGGLAAAPVQQAKLRMTNALWVKGDVVQSYLNQGIIHPDDVRVVAISAGRFGLYVSEDPPLIINSVFPIGDEFFVLNAAGEVVDHGFHPSFWIPKHGAVEPVAQTAFLTNAYAHVSGIIWSRAGLQSLGEKPTTFVHNPMASVPMPTDWTAWDKEYVAVESAAGWTLTNTKAAAANAI